MFGRRGKKRLEGAKKKLEEVTENGGPLAPIQARSGCGSSWGPRPEKLTGCRR
jgi:hypothetical protein